MLKPKVGYVNLKGEVVDKIREITQEDTHNIVYDTVKWSALVLGIVLLTLAGVMICDDAELNNKINRERDNQQLRHQTIVDKIYGIYKSVDNLEASNETVVYAANQQNKVIAILQKNNKDLTKRVDKLEETVRCMEMRIK